jgi:hypothetical protein
MLCERATAAVFTSGHQALLRVVAHTNNDVFLLCLTLDAHEVPARLEDERAVRHA